MDKPFDVKMAVTAPDGTTCEMNFSILDIKREFPCAICSSIGEREMISLLSLSDHFARHYVENNRAVQINAAIAEDLKKPNPPASNDTLRALRRDINDYDRAVDGAVQAPRYVSQYDGLTDEQMLRMALEESIREAELAKELSAKADLVKAVPASSVSTASSVPTASPLPSISSVSVQTVQSVQSVQSVQTPLTTVPIVTYPPRKKKNT